MASGPRRATVLRPVRTRFPSGSGTPIPWPRRAPRLAGLFYKRHAASSSARGILAVHGFRFCFTPLAGVLFAFPSRYFFAIGGRRVFSLGSWSTRIQAGFLVPRPTQAPHHGGGARCAYGAVTLSGGALRLLPLRVPTSSPPRVIPMRPYNPALGGLGSSPSARRYSGNLC